MVTRNNRFLFQLLHDFPLAGVEKSVKMSAGSLTNSGCLIGIDSQVIPETRLLQICQRLRMPPDYQKAFFDRLDKANVVLLGMEKDKETTVYKMYLEFWDELIRRLRKNPDDRQPALLHLGFKWHGPGKYKNMTTYTCYPLLTIPQILYRLAEIYVTYSNSDAYETVCAVVELAGRNMHRDSFIYLEAQEPGNPRRSFDLNLYKADLSLADIRPILDRAARRYELSNTSTADLFDSLARFPLGHISGGINRRGRDYLTVYFECPDLENL